MRRAGDGDPWDPGGAIPPTRTPAAARPDPSRESYADDRPRAGPRCASASARAWPARRHRADHAHRPRGPAKRDAALKRLKGRRFLAVRLNRLFQADGRAGIANFQRMAARFARLGLEVELQVRYHPRDRDDGDIAKWLRYVRSVVRAFGPNRA